MATCVVVMYVARAARRHDTVKLSNMLSIQPKVKSHSCYCTQKTLSTNTHTAMSFVVWWHHKMPRAAMSRKLKQKRPGTIFPGIWLCTTPPYRGSTAARCLRFALDVLKRQHTMHHTLNLLVVERITDRTPLNHNDLRPIATLHTLEERRGVRAIDISSRAR